MSTGYLPTLMGLLLLASMPGCLQGQAARPPLASLRLQSHYSAFPDTGRQEGHHYEGRFYDAANHYSDSTVLLFWPADLSPRGDIDLVFWFHGWFNSIDSANAYFRLAEQFAAARPRAVLVLAETARNAPESYGGRLEQPGDFALLCNQIRQILADRGVISRRSGLRHILLAGHSGAYRVIAYILRNGGLPVQEVLLFDALYSQLDKYLDWIGQDSRHRFIHWYTNQGGGTDEMSDTLMARLKSKGIPFTQAEEATVTPALISAQRLLFVHSSRGHNEIIRVPDNLTLLLQASPALLKKR